MGIVEHLVAQLSEALEREPSVHEHLGDAETTIAFSVGGPRSAQVTLRLSPGHVGIDGGATPDGLIALDADQATRLAAGTLATGAEIADGRLSCEGSVREYLAVDPILRSALRALGNDDPAGRDPVVVSSGAASVMPASDCLAIETRDVHKRFGSHEVLKGASLRIPEGTLSVVLGPSGTGKSVLIKHIIGALQPDRGEVVVRGHRLVDVSSRTLQEIRRDVGVMYQDGALFSSMTVYDNVAFSLREHTNLREGEIREIVLEHLRDVGLERAQKQFPSQLSGGMRKRAGLARAVVLEPRIILCDEPDSGLDPVRTALLGELLLERHARHGGTIMVVTHNIPLARLIADHLSLLWQGQIAITGPARSFFASEDPLLKQFLEGDTHGPLGMD